MLPHRDFRRCAGPTHDGAGARGRGLLRMAKKKPHPVWVRLEDSVRERTDVIVDYISSCGRLFSGQSMW